MLTGMGNFQPLEVVGRGSETQLQVPENLNKLDKFCILMHFSVQFKRKFLN